MAGSAQVDSRTTVPKAVSCSQTNVLSRIIRYPRDTLAWGRLFRLTRRRVPLRRVGLLELRTGDEGLVQILRIAHDAGDHQPDIAVGFAEAVEILLHARVSPVRHAVLAQIAGTDLRGEYLQIPILSRRPGRVGSPRGGRQPLRDPAEAASR